jgi:predicted SAM-dependent methyltransferase
LDKFKKRIKEGLKVMLGRSIAIPVPPIAQTPYSCNVCGKDNVIFNPFPMHYLHFLDKYQYVHNMFHGETINYMHFTCSDCEASDRDRLHALYFDEIKRSLGNKQISILDIAPYKPFSAYLNKQSNFNVRTADLFQEGVDDIVNIEDMNIYADETYDAFICSHVLEHIDNDEKGISELYRVTKKGGWGIVMVPILVSLKEDYYLPEVTSEEDRWKHYGHPDHRRMYSKKGFVQKLEKAGFKVLQLGIDHFGKENFERFGITDRSVLYVVQK